MTSPTNPLVFVYGSLKKGFHNHYPFLAERDALPLGEAVTVDPYLMLSGAAFPYLIDPASLSADHEACVADVIGKVKGELYVVDPETMNMLDRLEGHPDYYRRVEVMVEDDGEQAMAWVYFLQHPIEAIRRCPVVMPDESGTVEWTLERASAFQLGDIETDDLSEEG